MTPPRLDNLTNNFGQLSLSPIQPPLSREVRVFQQSREINPCPASLNQDFQQADKFAPDKTRALGITQFSTGSDWEYSCSKESALWLWQNHPEAFEIILLDWRSAGKKQGLLLALQDLGLIGPGWDRGHLSVTFSGLKILNPKMVDAILAEIPHRYDVAIGNIILPFPTYQDLILLIDGHTKSSHPLSGLICWEQHISPEVTSLELLEAFKVTAKILISAKGAGAGAFTTSVGELRQRLLDQEPIKQKLARIYHQLRQYLNPSEMAKLLCSDLASNDQEKIIDFLKTSDDARLREEVISRGPRNQEFLVKSAPHLSLEEQKRLLNSIIPNTLDALPLLFEMVEDESLREAVFYKLVASDIIPRDPQTNSHNFGHILATASLRSLASLLKAAKYRKVGFTEQETAPIPAIRWLELIQESEGPIQLDELTEVEEVGGVKTSPAILAHESGHFREAFRQRKKMAMLPFSDTSNTEVFRAIHRREFRLKSQPWELWEAFKAYQMRPHHLESLRAKLRAFIDVQLGQHATCTKAPQLADWDIWNKSGIGKPPASLTLMELAELDSPLVLIQKIADRLSPENRDRLSSDFDLLTTTEEKDALRACLTGLLRRIKGELLDYSDDPEGVESMMASLEASNHTLASRIANICAMSFVLNQSWHVRYTKDLFSRHQTFGLMILKNRLNVQPHQEEARPSLHTLVIYIPKHSKRSLDSATLTYLAQSSPRLSSLFIHGGYVSFPQGFSQLHALKSLALMKCRIKGSEIKHWRVPPNLSALLLDEIPVDFLGLSNLFNQSRIKVLRLSGADLDTKSVSLLKTHTHLKALNISFNKRIRAQQLSELADLKNLESLVMSTRQFSSRDERTAFIDRFPNTTFFHLLS